MYTMKLQGKMHINISAVPVKTECLYSKAKRRNDNDNDTAMTMRVTRKESLSISLHCPNIYYLENMRKLFENFKLRQVSRLATITMEQWNIKQNKYNISILVKMNNFIYTLHK